MGKLKTFTRRAFLVGSSAVAGGVAFGYYAYKQPGANPLLANLPEDGAALTPYVQIDAKGITLITPRADKGQGAYHVQAAMIAEELDVELDQVTLTPGVPSATYYNTALAGESVPLASTDRGAVAETVRGVADSMMKLLGMQITGGSTTVPDGYEKLRLAGASARETLKAAAAKETGLAIGDLKTAKGQVILPDGTAIDYVVLAKTAATLDPVQDVALRDPGTWRLLGKPMQRVDIVAKSTGTQSYGIDVDLPNMLHASLVMNPAQGGDFDSYDVTVAKTMRGVHSIVPVTNGVAVIADNTWRAIQAARAVDVVWGEAPMPKTMDTHWEVLSNSFSPDQLDSQVSAGGNVDRILANGDLIEAEYRAPYLAHAPLEPINATVRVNEDSVDVWTGTQIPRFVQTNLAKITGMDAENINVHVLMMGGSFGHRLEDLVVQQATQVAMSVPGTPVKLTYSREEDMMHDFTRQISMARLRGAHKNGQVEAMDLSIAMPSVTASQMARQGLPIPGPDSQITAGAQFQPFAIPNYRVSGYRAPELAPISSWRSVGASSNAFMHECAFDELIHAAGADPLGERLRLCSHDESRKVLEAVGEMSNWGSPLAANKGRGLAFCLSFGVACAEVVEVTHTDFGIKIDKVWVAAEVGRVMDPINFENQVQGGVIFALGHAMNCEITYEDGIAEQDNFYSFEGMRHYQTPTIEVCGLENGSRVYGCGEPPVPPAAPALANAIFAATGQRIREMPLNKFIDFV